jgi:hypothetical protein
MADKNTDKRPDKQQDVSRDTYDRGITPAETAARKEREGDLYKKTIHDEAGTEHVDTTSGYTVDNEGLVNNFAIEPEMYYEEPGDLKAKEEALEAERAEEIEEVRDTDKQGELSLEDDKRGKGTGII